jgi:tetratricopeptide (TPR) repeat protein
LPARASTFAAVQLFAQGVLRSRPGYAFTAQDWAHIAQICRLTAGMPLAIAIASAWTEWLSLDTIVAKIRGSLDFLEADLQDIPRRHRSIIALFDTSWRLLGERERIIFARLCIFRSAFTLAAADAVAGASLADLRLLATKSMIQTDGQGRFSIHTLLRKYGAARLAASPADNEATCDRHSAYYCATLHRQEAAWLHGEEVTAFSAIEQEVENHRAAWERAVARGAYARLLSAMDTLAEFYCWQSWYQEGEAAFARLHAELEKYDGGTTTLPEAAQRVYVRALIWQARFNQEFLGQPKRAEEQLQKGAALLETMASAGLDTRGEHAFLLMRLARLVAHQQGDRNAAQLRKRSLELSLESGDTFRAGLVATELGWAALQTAGHDEARSQFETGLTMFTALDHTLYRASVLCGLAAVAGLQGHFMESERLLEEAIASSNKRGVVEKVVSPHKWLGSVLRYQGKFAASESVLQEGIDLYMEAGWIVAACNLHSNQAFAKMHLGDYQAARRQSEAVCQSLYAHGRESSTVWGLVVLGMVSLAEGSWVEAQDYLQEALAKFERWQQRTDIARTLPLLALAQDALSHHTEAEKRLQAGIELSLEIRGYTMPLHVLPVVALRQADAGNVPEAVALYATASRYPMVAHSAWYRDVFGERIEHAAATLPGEQIAEATRQGQARDVWEVMADLAAA